MSDPVGYKKEWWDNHNRLSELVEWMDEKGFLSSEDGDKVRNICYLLEKPWKYDQEYREMLEFQQRKHEYDLGM